MAETIAEALRQAWENYQTGFARFLPRILVTLTIFVIGWLLAFVFGFLTRKVLGWLHLNALADRSGAGEVLKNAELPPADRVAGRLVFWLVFLGFLLSGLDALGFKGVEGLVARFLHFVPNLLVAVVIVVVGFVASNFLWRATLLAAFNARLPSARLLGNAVRVLVMILSVAMALEQIGVAKAGVLTAFAITFGAVMLGLAIAFGIGGGGLARRILEQQFTERDGTDTNGSSHL